MNVTVTGAALTDGAGGALAVRVLQETLTNAATHAPRQPVRIDAVEGADGLGFTVRNAIDAGERPKRTYGRGGAGLHALEHDVRRHDGLLSWEASPNEFVVHAQVPAVVSARHGATVDTAAEEMSSAFRIVSAAQRKGAAMLWGAGLIIVSALAAVELAMRGM